MAVDSSHSYCDSSVYFFRKMILFLIERGKENLLVDVSMCAITHGGQKKALGPQELVIYKVICFPIAVVNGSPWVLGT